MAIFCAVSFFSLSGLGNPATAASTLEDVRARGYVNCGVRAGSTGLSVAEPSGQWSGLFVEFCAALAAAVLGDKSAVKYRALPNGEGFRALKGGEVDVAMGASASLSNETEFGVRYVATLYHDGQAFLVRRVNAVMSVLELSGATVCILKGTRSAEGVQDFFKRYQMKIKAVPAEQWDEAARSYGAGACNVLCGERSVLALERSRMAEPIEHQILPESATTELYGPYVKRGDENWFTIVRWTINALVAAEEFGIDKSNVESIRAQKIALGHHLLGVNSDVGRGLGLKRDWGYEVLRQVGNYAEIFENTLGQKSPLKLERGANALWNKGGLMYAAPFR